MFTRVRGNTIQFAMPLQGKTFFAGGIAVYDFVPAPTDIITVVMQDRKAYTYTPTVQSNMLLWTDEGNLDVGMYSVEVLVERQDGTHLRCVRINQVNIVETNAESELDFPVVDSSAEETTPEQVEASQFEETVQGADSGTEETQETAASGEETPTRAVHTSDFEETGPSYDSDVPLTDGPNERFIPRDILSAGVFIFAGDGELGIREIAEGVFESRIVDVEAGLIHDYTAKIAISARELKSDYEEAIYDATGAITEAYQSEILQTARQISLTVEQYKSESDGHYSELSSELILQSDRIETKVSQADYDENNDLIEIRFSDVTQTAELIRQQVVDNKRDADGNFERMQSEITQNAAEISAKVSLLQYNADKQQYNQQFSELVLRSDQISAQVVANKTEEDALIQALERRIVMDENGISTLVANLNILGGEVTVAQSQIIQLANSIGLKVNQSDYNVDKQQILNRIATLTVDVDGIHAEVSSAEQTISAHTLVLAQYALDIQDLQNQIDGAIDTWFYDYPPVHVDSHGAPDSTVPLITDSQGNPVEPYYDWYYAETQAEPEKVRDSHLGDIFYDNASGYAYRFEGSGQPGSRVYSWAVIQDSAVITALENAARAQDTADHKRRVFVSQPYGPYDVGDLWVQGHVNTNDGAIFRCQTATSVENYFAAGDWVPAADYVSTKLERSNLEILSNAIVGTVSSYTYNADGTISSNTQSLIQQNASSIILQVAGTELATVGIYINGANDRIVLKSNNVFFQGSGDQTETALAITHDPLTGATKIAASNLEINNLVLGGYTGTSSAWQIWAGMSGEYDTTLAANRGGGVAGWFGGEKIDWKFLSTAERASQRYAKSLFRFDGSGYLAGGEIQWGANGDVIIHGTSIEGTTGTFTTLSDGTTTFSVADLIELKSWFTKAYYVDGNGVTHYYLKLVTSNDTGLEGFGTDGFVTAGGVGSGGGGGGGGLVQQIFRIGDFGGVFDTSANDTFNAYAINSLYTSIQSLNTAVNDKINRSVLWASLQNNDNVTTYDSYKIHTNHLPSISGTGITGTYSTSGTAPNLSTSLSLSVDVATILGYTPVASSALTGYLPLSAGSGKALTGNLYVGSRFIVRTERDSSHGSLFIGDYAGGYDDGIFYVGAGSESLSDNWFRIQSQSSILITADQTNLYSSDYTKSLYIDRNGYFTVGGRQTTYKLHVAGTFNATTLYENGTALSSKYLDTAGGTLTGALTIATSGESALNIGSSASGIYGAIYLYASGTKYTKITTAATGSYQTITIPNATGTLALTSDLGSYLPLAGGIMTGTINSTKHDLLSHNGNALLDAYTANGKETLYVIAEDKLYLASPTLYHLNGNASYTIWDSGNSNLTTVPWACSTLTASDDITVTKSNGRFTVVSSSASENFSFGASDSGYIYGSTNGVYLRFLSGRVGLGVDSPSYKLDIAGDVRISSSAAAALTLKRTSSGGGVYVYYFSNNQSTDYWRVGSDGVSPYRFVFQYGSTELASLSSTGQMSVKSSFKRTAKSSHYGDIILGDAGIGDDGLFYNSDSDQWFRIQSQSSIYISATQGTGTYAIRPDLFIDKTTGYIGAGTTSPQYKLDVSGVIHSTTGIFSDGYVTAGTASDIRLKENVNTLNREDAKRIVMGLRPVTFSWNALAHGLCEKYEGDDIGFIAQEVQPLVPQAIGSIFNDYLRMDSTKFIAPLVSIAQSHESRLDAAERKIREQDNRIASLEAENAELRARINN